MTTGVRSDLAEEFFSSIRKMLWGIRIIFREEMDKNGVTLPQLHLLGAIKDRGRATVCELSRYLMVAAPTTSRMIDGLCAKGFLRKERDQLDHRVTRLTLTGKSYRLLQDVTEFRNRTLDGILEGESDEEFRRTVDHLAELSDRWMAIAGGTIRESSDEQHRQR
jgi:DNA-binding MarR family transcriptional regulator